MNYEQALKCGIHHGITGDALVKSIHDNPYDATPSLVYADWLEENDKPTAASLIRKHYADRPNGTISLTRGANDSDGIKQFWIHSSVQGKGRVYLMHFGPGKHGGFFHTALYDSPEEAEQVSKRLSAEGIEEDN